MRVNIPLVAIALAFACTAGSKSESSGGTSGSTGSSGSSGSGDDSGGGGHSSGNDTGTVRPDDTGNGGPVSCEEQPPSLEIGTGDGEFIELAENEPVVMVHGPQGGWHMLGSVRTHNMHNVIEVHFTVTDVESGVVVADNRYRVAVVEDGDCTGYYPGMYGYLNVADLVTDEANRPPEVLGYNAVQMRMDVTDYEGREATQVLTVTAQPDPVDLESSDGDVDGS